MNRPVLNRDYIRNHTHGNVADTNQFEVDEPFPRFEGIEDGVFDGDFLPNLEELNLVDMNIGDLSFFHDLPSLDYLTLLDNVVTDITPLSIANMPKLAELYLTNNNITHLPENMHFPNLRILDLTNNNIQSFEPLRSANMPNLQEIIAEGNPGYTDAQEILNMVGTNRYRIKNAAV